MELYALQGECDDQLIWPAKAKFTLKLVNQKRGDDIKTEILKEWTKPSKQNFLGSFHCLYAGIYSAFKMLCNIDEYLYNDSLYFIITTELK